MRGRGDSGSVKTCKMYVNFASVCMCFDEWCRPIDVDVDVPDLGYDGSKVIPHPGVEGTDFEQIWSIGISEVVLMAKDVE